MSDAGVCVICEGSKSNNQHPCVYCNGTGEWNQAAESYLKNHICQCIVWGRKFCPICNKACHHDSSLSPKQKIDPGYGGMTSTISVTSQEEEMIVA